MKKADPHEGGNRPAFKMLLATLSTFAMVAFGLVAIPAPAATAEEPEVELPQTVSADFINTPQLNGVAWDLRVRGDVAYVVGSFTRVRPSGVAAGGSGEIVRNNAMAFNISTGKILDWNPNFNAPVLDIEFSPDGQMFYAAGQFSAVSGQARSKVAAFNTSNGSLTSFNASVGGSVETVAVTNDSVYIGGSFNSVAGQSRTNVAKLSRSNASLQPWAPAVDDIVQGLIATDSSNRVIIGGRFQTLNGQPRVGIGAVDRDSAQSLTWNADILPPRISENQRAWVVDLKLEDGVVYAANNGMGWHWFDGRFAASFETGDLIWLDNCYGSTSSISVMGDVLYSTPHAHDCTSVNGFPEENPQIWKRGLAETTFATGTDQTAPSNNSPVSNQPIPTLLHWYPSLNTGFYTGQYQGGWSLDNNGDYLVMGGEFTRLNNQNQQGLAVFPMRSETNNRRPEYTADLKPTVMNQGDGTVRVAWPTTWDYDDETLTYEVLRDNSLTALDSQDAASIWWKPQSLGFRDSSAQAGSTHQYRIRVSDPAGNSYIGPRSDAITVESGTPHPLTQALKDAGAVNHYPLNESSGTVVHDFLGFTDADASASPGFGAEGIFVEDSAADFDGQYLSTRGTSAAPDVYSTQIWFKTETKSGGKLIGFGNSRTGNSSSYDRHVWMDNSGKLHFGTWQGWAALVSSAESYNDGQWHQVVATLGEAGMTLSVDGLPVGQRTDVTSGQDYTGHWRIGGDNLSGWPNSPRSNNFDGSLDEIAIFDKQLGAQAILNLYQATGHTADVPEPPTDAYGMAIYADNPSMYWRLDETSGNLAQDATLAGIDGNIEGGVSLGVEGALGSGTGYGFGSTGAAVISKGAVNNPNVFSTEAWFKTTTDRGGKIIGFGNGASGLSSSYDRHVYMRDDGTLVFGTYSGGEFVVTTTDSYNDGQWHHVVSTLGADGMKLYVDGALKATNPQSVAENYTGYWRIGGDRLWSGASSQWFDGTIDEVAVYPRVLGAGEVDEHYSLVGAPNQAPVAAFEHVAQGLNVQFDASSSADADGTISDYSWDFGDGSTQAASTEGITHVYEQAGEYTVTLTITDDRGGQATASAQVTVAELPKPPVAAFTSEQNGLKLSVDGSTSTDPDGEITAWSWDFGDGSGTQTGETATHTYTEDGTYTVTLTVTDDQDETASTTAEVTVANGAPQASMEISLDGLKLNVDGSSSSDAEGGELSYAWDFGDGNTASTATAENTYAAEGTYEVTLTVTDAQGATGTTTQEVTVQVANTAPVVMVSSVITDLTVALDASASTDADGEIVSYEWNFADGTTATGATVEHTYATTDTYLITLVVTDDDGAQTTEEILVQVFEAGLNEPTPAFVTSTDQLELTVDASGSLPPENGGEITGYEWDFGDSATASGVTATHTYAEAGTYDVTLTVHAGERSRQLTQTVSVTLGQGPVAQFATTVNGLALQVDAAKSQAGDGAITDYLWDFGDGTTGTGEQASHRYSADGEYTVTLTLTDANGAQASTANTVAVANDAPVAAFSIATDGLGIAVDAADSADANGAIASYAWNFGDGSEASGASATHEYAEAGDYAITLTVTDEDGAEGTLTQNVQVSTPAQAEVLARDRFERSLSSGWGTAELGGNWTSSSSNANFSVTGGKGNIQMANGGSGPRIQLPVQLRESLFGLTISQDKDATGGGVYHYVVVRDVPGVGSYRMKLRVLSNGNVAGTFERILSGTITTLTPETVIGGISGGADEPLNVLIESSGTDATTLRAKVYNAGTSEPADWQIMAQDSTAGLQAAGSFGLGVYLSGSATNAPIVGSFDELLITELP
ncbi:PKD domain-containing protein [Glutamicibacter sp. HZAU]|uniref:PKD domain-containing protein n=1 Tax=Glutamicibacter sp. HZAU TaxID=2049891 RepID=UPI000FFC4BB1|nr:PKD domain-containing protein [Glutamicibacter sp. HZAU]RWZ83230.1 PKD domain-containing protein [Glutamicibacter sp. HZAU]